MVSALPQHIAIIMDGNGRWARARGLPRAAGHKAGVDAVRRVVEAAGNAGVQYLTLFGFSNENWSRPQDEISSLMGLLRMYLRAQAAELHKNNIRLRVIGRRDRFDVDIIEMIERVETLTSENTQLNLTIALDYGGRQDIVMAAQALAHSGDDFTQENFARHLATTDLPEPDFLIRTSGEQRISNFLLWQCAYTELYFTDTLWPDFTADTLHEALSAFAGRERRFGGIGQAAHVNTQ